MTLIVDDVIPEVQPRTIIKPLQNRTSKLRAEKIADQTLAKTRIDQDDTNLTPF